MHYPLCWQPEKFCLFTISITDYKHFPFMRFYLPFDFVLSYVAFDFHLNLSYVLFLMKNSVFVLSYFSMLYRSCPPAPAVVVV